MKQCRRIVPGLLQLMLITGLANSLGSAVLGQDNVVVRSRAERVAGQRKTEATFPEVSRGLRELRLRGKKLNDAQNIVKRYETETRSSREELQLLLNEAPREDFARGHSESPRATQIRATLQQAVDNLHAEIKTLLTPQQREQFERHLEKQNLQKDVSQRRSH
jgi:uncharacterized membrane protein